MPRSLPWCTAAAVATATALALAGPAGAHEERLVGGSDGLRMTVGWRDEPAFAGTRNAVEVTLGTAYGRPLDDAEEGLTVQVVYGGRASAPMTIAAAPAPAPAGEYATPLIPTRPGPYTFRFRGTVDGTPVDESFTSSPTTFPAVEEDAAISFPVADPSRGQMAQRLDRLGSRLDDASGRAADASGAATRATILAAVGAGLGAFGLGMMVSSRRRERVGAPQPRRS
jgi:hypothetical protein